MAVFTLGEKRRIFARVFPREDAADIVVQKLMSVLPWAKRAKHWLCAGQA